MARLSWSEIPLITFLSCFDHRTKALVSFTASCSSRETWPNSNSLKTKTSSRSVKRRAQHTLRFSCVQLTATWISFCSPLLKNMAGSECKRILVAHDLSCNVIPGMPINCFPSCKCGARCSVKTSGSIAGGEQGAVMLFKLIRARGPGEPGECRCRVSGAGELGFWAVRWLVFERCWRGKLLPMKGHVWRSLAFKVRGRVSEGSFEFDGEPGSGVAEDPGRKRTKRCTWARRSQQERIRTRA